MWLDLLISMPVTAVLVWIYWFFWPSGLSSGQRRLDALLILLAPVSLIVILVLGHAWIDYPGTGLNVMLVATAYIAVLSILGAASLLRLAMRARRKR